MSLIVFVLIASLLFIVLMLAFLLWRVYRQKSILDAEFSDLKEDFNSHIEESKRQFDLLQEKSDRLQKVMQASYDKLYLPYSFSLSKLNESHFEDMLPLLRKQLLELGIVYKDILPVLCGDCNSTRAMMDNIKLLQAKDIADVNLLRDSHPDVTTNPYKTSIEAIALNKILIDLGIDDTQWLLNGYKQTVKLENNEKPA